ncbi:MAG: phospholipid carrier-dependent glycosyltransferase [Calditrichaeota bacterium]|nr:MAG: phospholipid carrier-dependent glycosyltransferase [Calditrichota bacterium]
MKNTKIQPLPFIEGWLHGLNPFRFFTNITDWCKVHVDGLNQGFLLILSSFLHFWRLTIPPKLVFDEIYFPVFANNYLTRTPFFDAHPPLGKYIIALGIRIFGFNPLGYRVMDAIFGVAVVILIYRLGCLLFKDRRIGFLAGLFASLDGLLLVESRAGLINIFAVFFSLAAYYLFLKYGEENLRRSRWLYLFGAGVCIGSAAAVKWIGVASFGVIVVTYVYFKLLPKWPQLTRWPEQISFHKRLNKLHPSTFVLACLVLPLVVYSASFIIHLNQNPQFDFWELHRQMFGFHAHSRETHHYASRWWSWPVLMRPVSYFWEVDEKTQIASTILNLGNPFIWWFSIPAIFYGLWRALFRREFGVQFGLLAYMAHYLPFIVIKRSTYLYHYMGALPFAIILLAFVTVKLWSKEGVAREVAALTVLLIVLAAVYFFPIWTALPIPRGAFYQRMWFVSWI